MLKRISIFASGSLIGAVIDYVSTISLNNVFGVDPAVALGLSMTLSSCVVFLFHRHITFPEAHGNTAYRFLLFIAVTLLVFLLRAVLLKAFLYAGLALAIALFLAIGLASLMNFVISSTVTFSKKLS
ncbi:MAG: GtrA family protein [Mesorhizobium sp.]